jgi:hypothetical protein
LWLRPMSVGFIDWHGENELSPMEAAGRGPAYG